MGSLGFLCPFDFDSYQTHIDYVLQGDVPFTLRNRLSCRLETRSPNEGEHLSSSSNSSPGISSKLDINENSLGNRILKSNEWLSMNEVVIDRGSSPYLSNLDLYYCTRRWSHYLVANWINGIRNGCWCLHVSSKCTCNHYLSYLSSFPFIQAYCRSCWN